MMQNNSIDLSDSKLALCLRPPAKSDALLPLSHVWQGTKTRWFQGVEPTPGWGCCHTSMSHICSMSDITKGWFPKQPYIYLKGIKVLSKRTRALCDITGGWGGDFFFLMTSSSDVMTCWNFQIFGKTRCLEREELTSWGTVRYQYPLWHHRGNFRFQHMLSEKCGEQRKEILSSSLGELTERPETHYRWKTLVK